VHIWRPTAHWGVHAKLIYKYQNLHLHCIVATPCKRYRVVSQPEIAKKSIKILFWRSRSSKIIALGGNRKPVYDILLVINSNLGPISHRFWDTAIHWFKIVKFSYPLSFCVFGRGDPFRIYGKALRFLKLESSRQPTVNIGNPSSHRFWLIYLCDGRTDGRTDRIAMAKTRYSSTCCRA